MYIRKVKQVNKDTGREYFTHRLVETYRNADNKVRQQVLLNLGATFEIPQAQWKELADRIEEILVGQQSLIPPEEDLENIAQSIAKRVVHRVSVTKEPIKKYIQDSDYYTVDINTLKHQQIRQVGAEHVCVEALRKLELEKILQELNFNGKQISSAIGSIVGRLISPGSERSTHQYLQNQSALDELLGCDFQQLKLDNLYSIADKLLANKKAIEDKLFTKEKEIFDLENVITLYDLTNTYFEGRCAKNNKAAFGRSKEKRSDCPIVTLALVLDASGFPKKSEVFEGNVSEGKTLEKMISKLEGDKKPIVVMDAGIATEENIQWLSTSGYQYIVVSRKAKKISFDEIDASVTTLKHNKDYEIKAKLKINEETEERELYCYSELKAAKEDSMHTQAASRFEEKLSTLSAGLKKKGTSKRYQKVVERIGRLKERYRRVGMFYHIEVIANEAKDKAIDIQWTKQADKKRTPGVYCLRSNVSGLDVQTLWDTYITLTDLEAAFKCLKTELGLRPIYHQKTSRVDSHIFISVMAYHILQTIRFQLKAKGIDKSWATIRKELQTHCRITSTMKTKDGKTLHIRKTSHPSPQQSEIYQALEIPKTPGKTEKTLL